jgi:hypothetical protein
LLGLCAIECRDALQSAEPPGRLPAAATNARNGVSSLTPTTLPSAAERADAPSPSLANGSPQGTPAQLDPDGDDQTAPQGDDRRPLRPGHFTRVGKPPLALTRICDLTPFGGALYAAHANRPLGTDGATVSRYRPNDDKPFSVAFDWNRPGEPSQGGGAGQGFLRVHAVAGRLLVPDADPPYNGFGISEPGTEGFVFFSDSQGKFEPARMPGHRPPRTPEPDGRGGAAVLPRAYHVLDVIAFRGHLYAATGAVPPGERAWHGASPGALHVANAALTRFEYAVDYPHPWQDGVWRLTFLVRFRDRLYAGIQDYDGREPNDYLYFDPPRSAELISQHDLHAVRVTPSGGAQTVRWYADGGKLYWIAWTRGGVGLWVTDDGDHWRLVSLPADVGVPTDVTRFHGELVVLTERVLVRLNGTEATLLAQIGDKKSPFVMDDVLCAAPLAVFAGQLYLGGQRDGSLYRFDEEP